LWRLCLLSNNANLPDTLAVDILGEAVSVDGVSDCIMNNECIDTYVQTGSVLLICVASCLLHFLHGRSRGRNPASSFITIADNAFQVEKLLH
jgi:hypothetical protein